MFAIIETGGKQYRIAPGEKIIVEKLSGQAGEKVVLDKVLLVKNDSDQASFGNPLVSGASVTAEIVKTFKNDKVIIFKKRRRQNSRRKNGHRQQLTQIKILSINS